MEKEKELIFFIKLNYERQSRSLENLTMSKVISSKLANKE
jgi:hypothetical protein